MKLCDADAPVLLLCAHPDDEIGCGAVVNKLCQEGRMVHYVYFSDCGESTRAAGFEPKQLIEECHRSCAELGIPAERVRGFDIPVRHFPQYRQDILEILIKLRDEIRPQLVFVASQDDMHQDHATLTNEAVRAFKFANVLGYELPWNHLQSHLDMFVRVDRQHLDAKIRSWACYKSQAGRSYHGTSLIESLARLRGIQANAEFAESYEVMRLCL